MAQATHLTMLAGGAGAAGGVADELTHARKGIDKESKDAAPECWTLVVLRYCRLEEERSGPKDK